MDLNLSGKTALVCGGSKGLGYGTALELAKLNCKIILLARSEALLKEGTEKLNKINDLSNSYVIADMLDPDSFTKSISNLLTKESIHILINNTGGPSGGLIQNATAAQLLKGFKMHIIASQTLTQLILPSMKEAGYGRIINIVSTSVRQPISGLGVSNTIRGAMASWSKTLALELAKTGITVNNILPGTTKTERLNELLKSRQKQSDLSEQEAVDSFIKEIAMGRFAEVEEITGVTAFIASPAASYITGTSIPVDGGKIKSI